MKARLSRPLTATLLLALSGQALPDETALATYLANEGVLISRGATKALFDPLFDASYGQYQLLPDYMEKALFDGVAPFDGVDAVFVSHHHGDHFSPAMMLAYLRAQPHVRLYAPAQAVSGLRRASSPDDAPLFDRVTGLALEVGDAPLKFELADISITAIRIPHSGWPTRMTDVENIAFRVTLDDITVAHFGDADPAIEHYRQQTDYWGTHDAQLALPPYWFFASDDGRDALASEIRPVQAVGIHVPEAMPDDPAERPEEYRGFDLFTEPGETRQIH